MAEHSYGRKYWEHTPTGDIYMTLDATGEAINLRTGEPLLVADASFLCNFKKLNKQTADILESHFSQGPLFPTDSTHGSLFHVACRLRSPSQTPQNIGESKI